MAQGAKEGRGTGWRGRACFRVACGGCSQAREGASHPIPTTDPTYACARPHARTRKQARTRAGAGGKRHRRGTRRAAGHLGEELVEQHIGDLPRRSPRRGAQRILARMSARVRARRRRAGSAGLESGAAVRRAGGARGGGGPAAAGCRQRRSCWGRAPPRPPPVPRRSGRASPRAPAAPPPSGGEPARPPQAAVLPEVGKGNVGGHADQEICLVHLQLLRGGEDCCEQGRELRAAD